MEPTGGYSAKCLSQRRDGGCAADGGWRRRGIGGCAADGGCAAAVESTGGCAADGGWRRRGIGGCAADGGCAAVVEPTHDFWDANGTDFLEK